MSKICFYLKMVRYFINKHLQLTFLKFFEMLSLNANFAIIYPYYIPNIYLPVLKTQHHNEILDSLNRIKNKFTIYLTDLYSK